MTKDDIIEILKNVQDPDLKRDLVSLGMIQDLKVEGEHISFSIVLTTPACPLKSVMEADCRNQIGEKFPHAKISVTFKANTKGDKRLESVDLPIKNIIAVASGKGGVGKSSVAVNLALALAETGAKVGILDADIYGPSVPIMLGDNARPTVADSVKGEDGKEVQKLHPAEMHGIHAMSIGYLVAEGQALAWRGPMLHGILKQLLQDTVWPELDYLLIDTPPGTGDVQLSIPVLCPITGVVVVSSPQKVALSDTERGIHVFNQQKVPILGLIENMAGDIFGSGGGEEAAKNLEIPFLGRIELDSNIRKGSDSGYPLMISEASSSSAEQFRDIAGKLASRLAVRLVNQI